MTASIWAPNGFSPEVIPYKLFEYVATPSQVAFSIFPNTGILESQVEVYVSGEILNTDRFSIVGTDVILGFLTLGGEPIRIQVASAEFAPSPYDIPNIAGQSGKFLSNDGTSLLWSSAGGGGGGTFIANYSGAVTRSTQNKERDIVSAFDFMTEAEIADVRAGTLAIDVTSKLQDAINACSTSSQFGGQALYLPAGKYKIVSPLSIPRQFITIRGDGQWNSVISFNGVVGGCITTAVMAYCRPNFSDFGLQGDSSSGYAISFANVGSEVYLGELRNLYLESGADCLYAPRFFSMLVQQVSGLSYNGHSFRVNCGPGVSWVSCYALQAGIGKAGYRLAGQIYMYSCNGVNLADCWGCFGSNPAALDGFQTDFVGNDYPDINLFGCNIEEFGSISTNGIGILVVNNYRNFNMIGGKFDRTNLATGYKAIIYARSGSNGGARPIHLRPGYVFKGPGTPSLACFYTESGAHFSDESGAFELDGITTYYDSGVLVAYPTLKCGTEYTTPGLGYMTSPNSISPKSISIQSIRYKLLDVPTAGAAQSLDVSGYAKVKLTPGSASSYYRALNPTDFSKTGDLYIEAGDGFVTLEHNSPTTGGFRLLNGTNRKLNQGDIVHFVNSSNYRPGQPGWVEVGASILASNYTPVRTYDAGGNMTSVTAGRAIWSKTGNIVTVSGVLTAVRATGAGVAIRWYLSLPPEAPTVIVGLNDRVMGTWTCQDTEQSGNIANDALTNLAWFVGFSGAAIAATAQVVRYTYQYEVVG